MSVNGCGEGSEDFGRAAGRDRPGRRYRSLGASRLADGKVVGTSSYLKYTGACTAVSRRATFLNPRRGWASVNLESKSSMLGHAFDKADAIRVEFNVDVRNARSQAAAGKLDATVRAGCATTRSPRRGPYP